jgi:TP901 family phage tail tape measure protein
MADIAELIVALKLQDGVSSGLGRLNGQLRGMGTGFSQVGRGLGQVGTGLDRIATRGAIAAAAGLTAVVTAAVSFEDAFAGVRKTVDATEDQFGQLEDRLREMARTMPVSFEELAGIAEAGGALGIAFDGLDEFTKVVADLAATTDLSADQAATSLGVLGNVLGLLPEDFDNFGSALVDLGNKGASTETQILGIAERIGATGELIGLTSDQVLGFGAAVANTGIEVEAGGSALQRFFIDALTAVESGGEGLETFARTAGVSAESFRDSFRDDAGAALADFIEGLGELPEAVQIQTLADLGFNDVRITRTLLGLATDADNLRDSLNISAEAFAANSALGEEAAKRYATTASQLKILKQNVTDAAVTIGDELLPVVAELTSEFVAFINQPEVREGIKAFAEDLAGGIRSFVDEIKAADFGPLIDTLKGAADIAKAGFDAFRALPPGVQSLALAAFGINKLTGGALGGIASGLGNIIAGGLKIAFFDRGSVGNPMFVTVTNPSLGGGPTAAPITAGTWAGALGSALRGALSGAFAASLGASIGLAIGVPIFNASVQPAKDFERAALDDILNSDDLGRIRDGVKVLDDEIKRLSDLPPQAREAWRGVINILEEQRAELAARLPKLGPPIGSHPNFELRPGFSEARNVGDKPIPVTLPDTAMQPLTTAINGLKDAILREKDLTQGSEARNVTDNTDRIFVDSVKLDPSNIQDLREPTRIAAEQLRVLIADSRAADTANRTANAFLTAEMSRNRAETANRLSVLAGKYDVQNANSSTANRVLSSINAKTPPTHPVTVNNSISIPVNISATLIEQRLVTARLASVGIPTAPTLL